MSRVFHERARFSIALVQRRARSTEGSDLEVYSAILNGDSKLFAGLVEELAQAFVDEQIEYVVGDATEGYSVTHDICRVMIDAAVDLAERRHGHHVANFDFLVVGPPDECPDELRNEAIRIELDDESFARKVNAALAYSPKLALTSKLHSAARRFRASGVFRSRSWRVKSTSS